MDRIGWIGRGRARLERARQAGYLDATCALPPGLTHAHGQWCWRLRVPLIWCERNSRRSKLGRVHLDLFTTANLLTRRGIAELAAAASRFDVRGRVAISPADGIWEDVPLDRIDELCRTVYRIVTRLGNYEARQRTAIPAASKVLPWRISA